ncbi:GNAT family N-acetyltransferase [Nocardioides guangzhouensis]|uniref:GNAT family N-acetyltransferase n=1 Tax=Nocardioides guangzhouensis TaxID=2497878 RepID=A0A4Q4ZDF1_9ACTN|nr:GNAT family N-acetyltransferase [Nocardioides guangzhouensis]
MDLRPATPDDAAAGARLHLACWREAYGPLVDPALLEAALDEDRWTRRWREQVADGPPRLLAVHDDEPVGFVTCGPARHEDAPLPFELYAVYVRAAWHGTGVAQALLDAGLGDRSAYLWVLEGNARARRFYARNGFVADGGRQHYRPLDAWELRMLRRRAPS